MCQQPTCVSVAEVRMDTQDLASRYVCGDERCVLWAKAELGRLFEGFPVRRTDLDTHLEVFG